MKSKNKKPTKSKAKAKKKTAAKDFWDNCEFEIDWGDAAEAQEVQEVQEPEEVEYVFKNDLTKYDMRIVRKIAQSLVKSHNSLYDLLDESKHGVYTKSHAKMILMKISADFNLLYSTLATPIIRK